MYLNLQEGVPLFHKEKLKHSIASFLIDEEAQGTTQVPWRQLLRYLQAIGLPASIPKSFN